jgi:hypothetical protein
MALHPLKTEDIWIGRRHNDVAVWNPVMYDDTSTLDGAHAADSTPPARHDATGWRGYLRLAKNSHLGSKL